MLASFPTWWLHQFSRLPQSKYSTAVDSFSSMSYLTETATLEYDTSGTNHGSYDYHLPHTKTIDLIGEEFAPKPNRSQSQQQPEQVVQQPSVIVENINPSEPGTVNSSTPITTMSQQLGPNVVFVNTSGGSGVPLQVQQIIQQAQQQVWNLTF